LADRNGVISAGALVRLRLASDERLVALVRRGDAAAFEALYTRHARGLMSFSVYMLGSRQDAEDATQTTFASAYRALRADERSVNLRPWLFTIARNECLSILRRRHPTVELNGEPALTGDPGRELELREEIRHILGGLLELPEHQRAALVLAELHGLGQDEIATVLGVRTEQVKAYVYQARSNLIAGRRARETDCKDIREELATARGAALLRARLRRHLRSCTDCRGYADGVAHQRHQLGALLPLAPSLMLKYRALWDALGIAPPDSVAYARGAAVGGSAAATALELAGGGVKALAVKVAAGVAVVGAGAGVGVSLLGTPVTLGQGGPSVTTASTPSARAALGLASTTGSVAGEPAPSGRRRAHRGHLGAEGRESLVPTHSNRGPQSGPDRRGGSEAVGNPGALGTERPTGSQASGGRSEQEPPGSRTTESQGSSRREREQRQRKREGRQPQREGRQREREERQRTGRVHRPRVEGQEQEGEVPPVGIARPPRKSKAERLRAREEREKETSEGLGAGG
jgi:RNA polymerase sigma factor (sigma-70 family)